MTLVELIRALKEELKTNGDRELLPYITVENILEAPEPPQVVMTAGDSTTVPEAPAPDPLGPPKPVRGRVRRGETFTALGNAPMPDAESE